MEGRVNKPVQAQVCFCSHYTWEVGLPSIITIPACNEIVSCCSSPIIAQRIQSRIKQATVASAAAWELTKYPFFSISPPFLLVDLRLVRGVCCIIWLSGCGVHMLSGLLVTTGLLQTPAQRLNGQDQGCNASQQTTATVYGQGQIYWFPEHHLEPKHKNLGARWRNIYPYLKESDCRLVLELISTFKLAIQLPVLKVYIYCIRVKMITATMDTFHESSCSQNNFERIAYSSNGAVRLSLSFFYFSRVSLESTNRDGHFYKPVPQRG